MSAAAVVEDTPDLESLFDSIVAANAAPAAATATAAHVEDSAGELVARVGRLTRTLHDSLRELGYDKALASAASAIPDARDRLTYVAAMTEQAAQRVLTASEAAKPLQEALAAGADALAKRWDELLAGDPGVDEFKALVGATRDYLRETPAHARKTSAHLTEIILAQDFQDLTGQVIKKITDVAHSLERQLLDLLVDNAPPAKVQAASGVLHGPVINGHVQCDAVTSQQQVDELLESLGF
jgi:chemotaxis protein CheZ